jgi:hypothetical protein
MSIQGCQDARCNGTFSLPDSRIAPPEGMALILPERMCLIRVGSSSFVSSDKDAIRNEEWDQGSRIKAS